MHWKNTKKTYGTVARSLHWLVAGLVMITLLLGIFMSWLSVPDFVRPLHKSFGVLILGLMTLRLGWRLYSPAPPEPPLLKNWEKAMAALSHWLLYGLLLLQPLIGWAMSNAFGRPVSFLGLFNLPLLVMPDPELGALLKTFHSIIGYGLVALIAGHILAVPYHRRTKKLNLMYRIWPPVK